jgi:hypothetical protein
LAWFWSIIAGYYLVLDKHKPPTIASLAGGYLIFGSSIDSSGLVFHKNVKAKTEVILKQMHKMLACWSQTYTGGKNDE